MFKRTGGLKAYGVAILAMIAIVGCGGIAQRPASESGAIPSLDETIAALSPAERGELQRSMELPTGYDVETRAARDAFFAASAAREARDAEQRALELPMGDPETRAARAAFFRWLSDRGGTR